MEKASSYSCCNQQNRSATLYLAHRHAPVVLRLLSTRRCHDITPCIVSRVRDIGGGEKNGIHRLTRLEAEGLVSESKLQAYCNTEKGTNLISMCFAHALEPRVRLPLFSMNACFLTITYLFYFFLFFYCFFFFFIFPFSFAYTFLQNMSRYIYI